MSDTIPIILKKVLDDAGIQCEMEGVLISPSVSTYVIKPIDENNLAHIVRLADEFALALSAYPIRVLAPIPGKLQVDIEIPNENRTIVSIEEELNTKEYKEQVGSLVVSLGRDTKNNSRYVDLRKQINVLVGGATGSGKTNFFHSIFSSLTKRYGPQELKFILADAKRVEFSSVYSDSPYVIQPVILEYKNILNAFKWCLAEADRRIELMAKANLRTIEKYNEKTQEKLRYTVILIDEFSDFALADEDGKLISTMVEVMQIARLVGFVVLIGSSRPCSETFPPILVQNCPSRFAFSTASINDSQFILEESGAEKLLGQGDGLFLGIDGYEQDWKEKYPVRLQTPYVSDESITKAGSRK